MSVVEEKEVVIWMVFEKVMDLICVVVMRVIQMLDCIQRYFF